MLYATVRRKSCRCCIKHVQRVTFGLDVHSTWISHGRCHCLRFRLYASSVPPAGKQMDPAEPSVQGQPLHPTDSEAASTRSTISVKGTAWEQIKPIRRELAITIMSTGVLALGIGAVVPVLPLFVREAAGSSNTAVGLALAAPSLTRALLNPVVGDWADRHGRKPLLVCGPLISAISQILTGLCASIEGILPWRLLLGAGQAVQSTGGQMLLADLTQRVPEVRARVMGTTQSSFMIGFSLGPGLSGFLVDAYGPQSAFFAVAAGCTLAGLCNCFLRETLPSEVRAAAMKRMKELQVQDGSGHADEANGSSEKNQNALMWGLQWAESVRTSRDIKAAAVVQGASAVVFGGGFTVMPLLMTEVYGATGAQLGGAFTAMALSNLVGSGVGAFVADSFGRKVAAVPAICVQAVALMAMSGSPDLFTIVALSCVRSAAGGALMPGLNAFCADAVPPENRGPSLAALRTISDIGWLVGPILSGLLADATSPATVLLANGIIMGGVGAYFQLCARETLQTAKLTADRIDSKTKAS
eukprot:gnl/MRDRNA2_/MRDRNA2_102507_c0_seq1.p1 gnl/MRDRNA2_/MRDRNA2_102507_c0~~gnl/MRDRNA2_/MRDRNA2_102507_c0_seq1.p1  ORF type:complete len:528 (-),score=72.41 gnl/MRDRNA2_/MRDRNA2_102507_c0_seq1:88-1671(-)